MLESAALFGGMNFYRDAANLTRLDDFVEVKVGRRASGGRHSSGRDSSSQEAVACIPRSISKVSGFDIAHADRRLVREFERRCSRVAYAKCRFQLFSGENVAKVTPGHRYYDLGSSR